MYDSSESIILGTLVPQTQRPQERERQVIYIVLLTLFKYNKNQDLNMCKQ